MTNIIKAPIKKIRRRGPNGEYHIKWDDIKDSIDELRLCLDACDPREEGGALFQGFAHIPFTTDISDDSEKEDANLVYIPALMFKSDTGRLSFFALKELMPELECW